MRIDLLSLSAFITGIVFFIFILYLHIKKNVDFGIRTILGLILGVLTGILFRGHLDYLVTVGRIYTNLISASVIPLLFFSIISSISSLNNIGRLKAIGLKSMGWLFTNTLTASIITLGIGLLFGIGKGGSYTLPSDYQAREVPTFIDTIVNLFPNNIVSHAANGEVVPFIVFAVLIGVGLVTVHSNDAKAAEPFKIWIDSANKIIYTVIGFVIELTPYAVLSLTANAVSSNGLSKLMPLIGVIAAAYLACGIQLFIIDGLLIKLFGGLNPITFFQGIWPALVVAFTSQTSIGTIPVTIKQLRDKLGVKEETASFVSGLGANMGMPGCAGVWPVLLAIFAINALEIPYSTGQYIFLVILSLAVSLGTVGVPGTSTITATAVFAAAGLPIEIIVILAPVSSIVDMARTATNVGGAATAAFLTAKSEKEIDFEVYHGRTIVNNMKINGSSNHI